MVFSSPNETTEQDKNTQKYTSTGLRLQIMQPGINYRIIKAAGTSGCPLQMEIPPPLWVPVPVSDHPFIVKGWGVFSQSEFLLLQFALVASHLFTEHLKESLSLSPL